MIQFSQMQASFNAATTIVDVAKLIGEVRDRLEIVHTSEFANFMHHLFPILRDLVVVKTSPQLEDNPENKVRHSLLEIINKFPNNETLKPYVYEIMILSLKVLADDNEENAIIALKIVFDLHKSFRPSLEQYILPFLDTVSRLYANMPAASRAIYGSTVPSTSTTSTPFVRSVESFKVLTECPIIVMLLFQFYPRFVAKTMTQMVPVMLSTLSLSPSFAPNAVVYPQQRQRYREFLAAQVKTLSFLTFLLRSYSDFLKTFEPSIVKSVLMLLHRCPEESVATRRELLIATRHILATDFRRGFQPHVDDLLDENLFLGPGHPASLRPVAYSTIGDLVHHMKETLSMTQIVKVANMFAVTVHDLTLPVSLHVSAVRVLFTITERLHQTELGDDTVCSAQYLLHHIFRNLVEKLRILRLHVEDSFDLEARVKNNANYLEERDVVSDTDLGGTPTTSTLSSSLNSQSAIYLFREDSAVQEQTVKDVKILIRTILGSMKVTCQTIQNVDQAAKVTSSHSLGGAVTRESALLHSVAQMTVVKDHISGLVRLFRYAIECGGYYLPDKADRFQNPFDRNTDILTHHALSKAGGSGVGGGSGTHHPSSASVSVSAVSVATSESKSSQCSRSVKEDMNKHDKVTPNGSANAAEILDHITSITVPFSLLEPKTLSLVLHSAMKYFIGTAFNAPKENYFFTSVIETLMTSCMPSVNLACLQAVFSATSLRIRGRGSQAMATWPDNDSSPSSSPSQNTQYEFESRSALCTVFTSALKSIHRYPENETALSSRLNILISDVLRMANMLPLRDLRHSLCLHFLRLIFKTLQSKVLRQCLIMFRTLFSTVLLSLEGLLSRVLPCDIGLRAEIMELICSIPLDIESLTAHSASLLGHCHSSLQLRASESEIGVLYNAALSLLESCVDMLSLSVLSQTLSSCTTVSEGLYRELSRHLQPKPYPLGDIACRLAGKLGCSYAFFRASHKHGTMERFTASTQSHTQALGDGDSKYSLTVMANTCLYPLEEEVVVCSDVCISLDHILEGACGVFNTSPTLPITHSEDENLLESSLLDTDICGQESPQFKDMDKMKKNGKHDAVTASSTGPTLGLIDHSRPCLDTTSLQKENSSILHIARVQYRADAMTVLEGGVARILSAVARRQRYVEKGLDNNDNNDDNMMCIASSNLEIIGNRGEMKDESVKCYRPLLSRILSSVYTATADPRLKFRAMGIIDSVFSFIATSGTKGNQDCLKDGDDDDDVNSFSLGVQDVMDAVCDVILHPLCTSTSTCVRPYAEEEVKHSVSSHFTQRFFNIVLRSYTVRNINKDSSVEDQQIDWVTTPVLAKEGSGACSLQDIPTDEPCVLHLISRCLTGMSSNTWGGRQASALVLCDLSGLLPMYWLTPHLEDLVHGLLCALEYPFTLTGPRGVECILRTIRTLIDACLSTSSNVSSSTSTSSSSSAISGIDMNEVRCSVSVTDVSASGGVGEGEGVASIHHTVEVKQCTKNQGTASNTFLRSLISSLFHPSPQVNIASKCALVQISRVLCAKGEGANVSIVLQPLKEFINDEINERLSRFGDMKGNADQGFLSGLTFCCNLSPPLVKVNKEIMSLFAITLIATESEAMPPPLFPYLGGGPHRDPAEDDLLLTLQNHPYPVHGAVVCRLMFVRLTHALCSATTASAEVALAVLNDENRDTLQRTFSLLFKGLGSVWEDIAGWSQRTLHLLIGLKATPFITSETYESIFPRDLLQQCLQPLLVPLSSPRKVSLSGIRGVECVLRLVTNVKFLQFGDKILEHMRMFLEPEKLAAMQLWEPGTEEWVASSLLDLLHLLPWLPNNGSGPSDPTTQGSTQSAPKMILRAFLHNFATTVSDLDVVWKRFRPSASSPFIPPLAKFLTRYPVEAVKFFFSAERILDQELCDLLLQVLDSDCTCLSSFEKVIASNESVNILLKLCLIPLLKKDEDQDKDKEGSEGTAKYHEGSSLSEVASDALQGGQKDPTRLPLPPFKAGVIAGLGVGQRVGVGAEEDAASQRSATLAYNALRLLQKMSERCPAILFNNPSLLSVLRHLVPLCLTISEGSVAVHPPSPAPLVFLDYAQHLKGIVTMEAAYRHAHQLQLLCEIIIQYCKMHRSDSTSHLFGYDTFELMAFSLLPVLTMRLCILDFTFLLDFFKRDVPSLCTSPASKKKILRKTFSLVAGKRASAALKVKVIQVLALPLLIKILLEKDDDKDKKKEKDKDRRSTDSHHSDGRGRDKEHSSSSSALINSNSNSSSSSSSSSSGRGLGGITCSTIVQIFDAEMILLIMQDVIGMTCHGINTSSSTSSAAQGGGLERTTSQDREGRDPSEGIERDTDRERERDRDRDRDRERDSKEGSSRIETEERGGDDLERGRKRDPLGSDKDSLVGQSDAASNLKIELLKISTLFLEHLFPLFKLYKKDIIKFAWNHIKADDSATRHWSYINICRFVSSFDSPPKIIIQVYVALLRSFHPEGRELIRRALDTLVPVLPARLLPEDLYKVVKWTKKILVDDGYSMPQMCHIWHMIIRFSDVFYSYRSQLVPQMLNAVTRIGLSGNAASEFRLVAVAIADLVITWEIKKPDKMPEYTVGGLPSSLITPPLPTMRKRLLSEETAPIAPRGRHTTDTSESRPAATAVAEDSGERVVKRSRIEEKLSDYNNSSDSPPIGGAAGAHYLSKKIEMEPMSSQMTLSGIAGASSAHAAVTLSDSTGTGSLSKMKMESGQVQLPGIGDEKQLNKSLLQMQRGSGTTTLSTQPTSSGPEREGADESYTLPRALVQVLANFVMRLCIFATDNKDAVVAKLSSRCLRLFEKMSALPAMRSVPLPYYERLLQNALDGFNQSAAPAVPAVDPSGATTGVTGPGTGPIPPVPADKPPSKPAALGAAGGSSSRSIPQGISDTMLCNLLDIASSSLTCAGGPNKLFEQNAYHLKELHAPVFASETPKVHESYKKFLRTVLTVYPCTLSVPSPLETSGFMGQLVGVISLGLKVKVSCLKEAQSLLLLLQVVSAVCGVQSILVENFGSALLRIGHVMLGDHVQGAVGRAHRRRRGRTGTNATLTDSRTDMASREFFEESCLASLLQEGDGENRKEAGRVYDDPSSAGVTSEGRRGREDSISNNSLEDLSGKILASCLSILFQSIDKGRLEQQKPVIVSLLAAAVEGVDSTLLINLASSRCLRWVGHARSPLSLGEQVVVFSRISCHSMRVQRDCKQAILARFAAVSERIGELTCLEMKRSSANYYDSSDHRLGILALLSPVASLRNGCMKRIFDHWGPSLSQRLEGLFSLDLSSQFHSQWPSILTCIALDAVHGLDLSYSSADGSDNLSDQRACSNDKWLQALSSFALSSPASGHEICLTMLQAMWEELNQKKRDKLSMAIANNIIQAKHTIPVSCVAATTQSSCYTPRTIPQQILLVFAQLVPTPRFPLEFLSCLGLSGCEGEAAPLLEAMVASSTSNKEAKRSRTGLLASLDLLEDRDMVRALLRSCSSSRVTDLALSLETYGRSDLAQSVVLRAISNVPPSDGSMVNAEWAVESMKESTLGNKDLLKGQAHQDDDDTELWLCRWVQYAKELSDWSLLSSFAASAGVTDISIESAVTLGDWEGVKGLKTSSASLLATGGLKMKIFDCMLNLVERRYPEATEAISDATQIALYRWQQLPSANGSASCHRTMMSSLQRILELEEGRNMLLNAQGCSTARVLPDLSPSLGLWRDRLPDKAENMLQWDSLLHWRANLFAGVSRIFRGGPDDSRLAAVTDASWTTLQLVAAARRHGLCEVGLKASVPLLSLSTLDVTDAFSKVREQVLLCLSSRATDSTAGGLHIVNTTNLDFFGPDQRAEMFRLKGLCNWSLGNNAEAQDCFSRSVQLGGGKRGRDWLSWGHLCYDIWEKGTFRTHGTKNDSQDLKNGCKGRLQWCSEHAVSSIVCILKAVECDSVPAKMLLPRVLWILECCYSAAADADSADSNDEEEGGREMQLTQLMEGFICQAQEIPSWNWLPYLGALFSFLKRPGGGLFVPLIKRLIDCYPQRVIAYLLKEEKEKEKESAEESVVGGAVGHQSTCDNTAADTDTVTALQRVNDLINHTKLTHGPLWTRIGWFSKEILRASEPSPLETVVTGLKTICKDYMKISLHRLDEVSSLEIKQKLLEGINTCITHVEVESIHASSSSSSSLLSLSGVPKQHSNLLQIVKEEVKDIFHIKEECSFPVQLNLEQGNEILISKILTRVRHWILLMTSLLKKKCLADSNFKKCSLSRETSNKGYSYNYFELDGRAQSLTGMCVPSPCSPFRAPPDNQSTSKVIRVCSKDAAARTPRDSSSSSSESGRRIELLCSDGVNYFYSVADQSPSGIVEVEKQERYSMLCGVVNWSLEQHLPSRGRALSIHTLGVIRVGGGVILTEAKSIPSLNDIYLNHCALTHDDPHWLLGAAHEFIESADDQTSMTHEERKRKIYEESCNFIPSTILHDRISKSCKSIAESYSARREYACQLGLNAGMQYLLSAPALSTDQMHVCLSSGVVVSTGVAPSYKMSPLLQSSPNSRRGSRTAPGVIDRDTDDTHVECLERNVNLPFRLTRNVVGALSGHMVLGGLTVSLGLTMDACLSNKDVIEVSLSLLLISDLRSRHPAAVDCYPSVTLIKDMTSSLLHEIESKAPSTQIKEFEAKESNNDPQNKNSSIINSTLAVDFHVQELVQKSMAESNILQVEDQSWLPWM